MKAVRVLPRRLAGRGFEQDGLQGGAGRREQVPSGSGSEGAVQGLFGRWGGVSCVGVDPCMLWPLQTIVRTTPDVPARRGRKKSYYAFSPNLARDEPHVSISSSIFLA